MLAAGLFEYNFGDSEFLMLFLVLVTLPYAAERAARTAPRLMRAADRASTAPARSSRRFPDAVGRSWSAT